MILYITEGCLAGICRRGQTSKKGTINRFDNMNEAAEIFHTNRRKFSVLYVFIGGIHKQIVQRGVSNHGHGFDHDLMVAQYGAIVAQGERVGQMAWVAGLLHSLDRHFPEDRARELVEEGLAYVSDEFTETEVDQIRTAVADHSKLNDDMDGPVSVALKDADRLANLGAINIIRGGQHRPNIPACIMETLGRLHPESTFKNPKSCFDATFYNLEWRNMLRLPKSKQLGERYFTFLLEWQALAVSQSAEVGLYPWPV